MKVISLTQPWATLMALGAKRIETRSWGSPYRGPVAIHAALNFPADARATCYRTPFAEHLARSRYDKPDDLPRGAIVCVVDLMTVRVFGGRASDDISWLREYGAADEEAFGNYGPERRAWRTTNLRRLARPVPHRGAQGLRDLPDDVVVAVVAELNRSAA